MSTQRDWKTSVGYWVTEMKTTLRERPLSVAKLVALGMSNKQIASRLFISAKTVEKHRAKANHYFNVDSALSLARALLRGGQLSVEEFLAARHGDDIRHIPGEVREERLKNEVTVVGMKFF